MELIAKGEFYRNISLLKNRKLIKAVYVSLKQVEQAVDISEIQHLKKLKKFKAHYRIKVSREYRIGIIIRGNKIWIVCFGHRYNFYKNFP